MKRVAVLGSTGSIGTNALDVMEALPDRFEIVSLSAGRNTDLLCAQTERFRPRRVCVRGDGVGLKDRLPAEVEILEGEGGLIDLAVDEEVDLVVNGLVAGVGIRPTVAAVEAGKDVATANKETLVVAGHLVTELARSHGGALVPLDSELTPIWQTLELHSDRDVRKIILPASGGPFSASSRTEMAAVTPDAALNHPTWKMGPKITIDSATLMNKGLEIIEACVLFGLDPADVDVVIHPQSLVHCLVEYKDGSILTQMGNPDMRTPIAAALGFPDRLTSGTRSLDICEMGQLTFMEPSEERYPCLSLARQAAEAGGTAPAALNAANEEAVLAFCEGRIRFTGIYPLVDQTMQCLEPEQSTTLESVLSVDRKAREVARSLLGCKVSVLSTQAVNL